MKSDYIVVTNQNEWIASLTDVTLAEAESEILDDMDLSMFKGTKAYIFEVNSIIQPEGEVNL